ncbi:hypothetical protein EAX61_10250 [Dokdonia sinensis]|uniref:Transposase IS200-like domain-containing protein n=1 Tax=Dokdonia sinensis TaxID=2479847 RepID=A0A3M0FZ96_9FLAO|nr:transposase [Dokdonia sinensis]RMB57994.1 hypothetical protein EAX61_10250 [Dokdonia sinensis]
MKLEMLEKDLYYHIYNRGNDSEVIFRNDENKRYFLSLAAKHLDQAVSILAYCLIDNHYHFLLKIDTEEHTATQKFSNLFNAYAKAYNKRFNRTGSLFEKHFRRKKITSEAYLRNLIIYIHRNPLNHGVTPDFANFKFSSYRFCIEPLLSSPIALDKEETISYFDDLENFKFVHLRQANFRDEEGVDW